jgi:Sigma-70, region 4
LPPREYGRIDDRLTGSIDRIALARAIQELPDGYRTIFLLHEVAGFEHQEIAKFLDCSVGNSKSQLHKAKLRIRELLRRARPELNEQKQRWEAGHSRPAASPVPRQSEAREQRDPEPVGQREPSAFPGLSPLFATHL